MPLNTAVLAGNTVCLGGISALSQNNQQVITADIAEQTTEIIARMTALLARADMTLEHLVFVTVYLTDLQHLSRVNTVYSKLIPHPYPARKVVQTPLIVEGALVEMTALAINAEKVIL